MISASRQSGGVASAWGGPVLAAVGAAVLAFAYGPLLWEFAGDLWARPYYQHFPYVLLAAGILGYLQLRDAPAAPGHPIAAVAMLTAAWAVLVLAVIALWPLLAAISAILLSGGLLLAYCGQVGCQFPAGPWLLLWLVLPPPVGLDQRLLTRLQLTSSDLASKALDLLSVSHLMEGNTLILPTKNLFVDEACSGIVSVISLSACGAIYGVWRRRSLVHTAALIASAVAWAVLMNVVRIVAIALAEAYGGVDLADDIAHTLLGLGVFSLNLLAIACLDWLFAYLFGEISMAETTSNDSSSPLENWAIETWNWLAGRHEWPQDRGATKQNRSLPRVAIGPMLALPVLSFAAVGFGSVLLPHSVEATRIQSVRIDADKFVDSLAFADLMPDRILDLQLVDIESIRRDRDDSLGERSIVWQYRDAADRPYLVSCDLPFDGGWHELSSCYMSIGWEVSKREIFPIANEPGAWVRLSLRRQDHSNATVTFCCIVPGNGTMDPPLYWGTLRKLWQEFTKRNEIAARTHFYQLQVKFEHEGRNIQQQIDRSEELLAELDRRVRMKLQPATSL